MRLRVSVRYWLMRAMQYTTLQRALALMIFTLFSAHGVAAQTDNRLAVGGSITSRIAGSSSTDASSDIGFELRLGHEQQQWGWAYSFFGWYDMDLMASPTLPTFLDRGPTAMHRCPFWTALFLAAIGASTSAADLQLLPGHARLDGPKARRWARSVSRCRRVKTRKRALCASNCGHAASNCRREKARR